MCYTCFYFCVTDILENIEAESGSAAAKLKIMYDSCVNLGKLEISYYFLGLLHIKM